MAAALAAALVTTGACASDGAGDRPGTSSTGTQGRPQPGGTLRVGIVGGSAKDTLDAHAPVTQPDEARITQLFDGLAEYDNEHRVRLALARDVAASEDAKTWTVTLREGLEFSDGTPLTADDVVFTFRRITDPKNPKAAAETFATLDRSGLRAEDDLTVVFPFTKPFSIFRSAIALIGTGIVPEGYEPAKPISSGPFILKSFTSGAQSEFVKNEHYWREGEPYVDAVRIIDFPDDTARVNALLGGQVDAIAGVPLGQVKVIEANPGLKVLESPTGTWLPFTMRIDRPPFDDPLVREAFRLIVDRKQMVDQVLNGHGRIANDMYAPLDPCYPADTEQRAQDIARAKALLAEAGQADLNVELVTSPVAAGMVEAAQVFAQQAKEAGVTVKVNKVDPREFYGDKYLQWTFAQDYWFTHDYLEQALLATMPDAPYNETHWADPEWQQIVDTALATTDDDERCSLIQKAQQIEFDSGGYLIWGFTNSLDAHSSAVQGFRPDKSGAPLSSYRFREVGFVR